eukprot:s587_g11.t1
MAEQAALDLGSLVPLTHDIEPYVLEWPAPEEGSNEVLFLVLQRRANGFLAAIPVGVVPEEILAVGNSDAPPGPVGPSTAFIVPLKILDNGVLTDSGDQGSVLVVDFHESVLQHVRLPEAFEDIHFSFDPDQPFGIPSPTELMARVRDWLSAGGVSSAGGYLTAMEEENIDGDFLEDGDLPPQEDLPATPRTSPAKASTAAQPKRDRKPAVRGQDPPTASAKKPTVASLSHALSQLLETNMGMSNQLQALSQRQQIIEQQLVALPSQSDLHPSSALRLPISASLTSQPSKPQAIAKSLGTPPRTIPPAPSGLLQSPSVNKPQPLLELEGEKPQTAQSSWSDPMARAVMAQAQALTDLVGQIASQSGDPMMDLVGGGSMTGTRGAVGRAKLQNELAQQKGLFFQSVLCQMARRMQPTMPANASPADLLARGVTGTQYLERYGGYGKHRELGTLQFQVMSIMDFLQANNMEAAKDATALLSVVLDQACLDNGRFDLANVLCLQEEPPASIFTHKPVSLFSRSRAFSPLADQKWITVALAYLKELDTITAKRLELGSQSKPAPFASSAWILKTRTKFAFCLRRSFAVKRRSPESSSTVFPLPLASLECFLSSGPGLSVRRWTSRCRARIINLWILVLDFLYLSRWPTADELRRTPSSKQLAVFEHLRRSLTVCGNPLDEFPLCPGRTGPELGASIFQVEKFAETCPVFESGYMAAERMDFKEKPDLVPVSRHPELAPYRSLCADRLKLVGEGAWPMESFLDGVLWLPYQDPSFLLHGFPLADCDLPSFQAEDPLECEKLALIWDAKNLLAVFEAPVEPGMFCRVFNAFKNTDCDRQIGDRRLPNVSEYHVDGPSRFLPQGHQLTMLHVPKFSHCIRGSMTDRRDFYHQAQVSLERAKMNMLPFPIATDQLSGTKAHADLVARLQQNPKASRDAVGDGFRSGLPKRSKKQKVPSEVYPAFKSLFQGDHLGVEFALRSHEVLLEGGGLLHPSTRIRGHLPFPVGPNYDALVIDDYFSLSVEAGDSLPDAGFAHQSLLAARGIYEAEKLQGSPEKDVDASLTLKAAGAEIRSSLENVKLGYVPVGAPVAKRLALSVLSLRAACLPATNGKILSRLAGNWVAVLQYRKCLSSIIDDMFRVASECLADDPTSLRPLPRKISNELAMLATVAPLIFSNLTARYFDRIFATDSSNQKGAIVEAVVDQDTQKVLWLDADRKGGYTHLNNPFNALLRQVGEQDDDDEHGHPFAEEEPIHKSPLMYFDFVEICGGAGKVGDSLRRLGFSVAPVLDLSESVHYDLTSLRLMEWIIYMLEEGRFRSFMIEPPCTSFSPAAHPAVRSYAEPLGFDRLLPKTLLGNTLAFRALCLLRVGRRCRRPCAAEQSRLSKMCWLDLWISLRSQGFSEAIIASCVFQSIHRKEFRLLCHLLDTGMLDRRCPGGHSHVRIQGAYTRPSAVYTDALADHIALAFKRSLEALNSEDRLMPATDGLENLFANDVMLSAPWKVSRSWFWKRQGHINVLELGSAVSGLVERAEEAFSVRFANLIDSSVCRSALSKGRSASVALQPGLRRVGAVSIAADLYPAWIFSPTRWAGRINSELSATRTLRPQTRDKRELYLASFRRWLWEEKSVSFRFLVDQKPADPERIAALLVEYGRGLYHAGKAYGIYAETINAVACMRPLIKRQLTSAWDLAFQWLCEEPYDHNPAMPLSVLAAMVVVSLTWGWPHFAAVLMMSWAGVMRIGEVLAATRQELVLPADCAPGTPFALILIKSPKTRGRAANHQAARIDQEDIVRFLSAMYGDAPKETKIWPFSAATLRKRFTEVLKALRLPSDKSGGQKPFSLGSMRPGGATWLLHRTENSEVVRRRGRWLSVKVMEIYLQEVLVCTFMEKVRPRARVLIDLCSGGFETTLDRCIDFLQCGIPTPTWFYLLRDPAKLPTQKFGKTGVDGQFSHETKADNQKNFPEHDSEKTVRPSFDSSLGYLRFSRPVSVRSLFVHWDVDRGAARALVAGRLGLETAWSSHLDPKQLELEKGWIDIAGDPLVAEGGLRIGQNFALLCKSFGPMLHHWLLPFKRRALGGPRGDHVPGLLSLRTAQESGELTEESLNFRLAAHHNGNLFSGIYLIDMASHDANDMLDGFTRVPAGVLPEDLRRQLAMEGPALAETIRQHVRAGGWKRSTPTRLPHEGCLDPPWTQVDFGSGKVDVGDAPADVASAPGLPCGWVTWALWSMALLVVFLLVIGVVLWDRRLRITRRWCRKRSEKDAVEDVCTTSVEAVLPGPQEDVEKAPSVEEQSWGLQRYIEELQVKHQEELRQRDAKMEENGAMGDAMGGSEWRGDGIEVKQELREKTAEGLELWEDAKRQRKEANRCLASSSLQSFAISATNSLRKVQREVNRLQRVIAQQKAKYVELQESQRARREVLMLKELDLARREAEVSSLAQAEQDQVTADELAELREWLAAPEGAKDEHRQIAGLRAEVKEWQETYKKDKASWMRAICELTKQRDLQVSRADLFAKQLGQWRDIFQETDLTNLEEQELRVSGILSPVLPMKMLNVESRAKALLRCFTCHLREVIVRHDRALIDVTIVTVLKCNAPAPNCAFMAAFSDVGAICSEASCRRQDFLPTSCFACKRLFCQEHYRPELHSCDAVRESPPLEEPPSPKRRQPCAAPGCKEQISEWRWSASGLSRRHAKEVALTSTWARPPPHMLPLGMSLAAFGAAASLSRRSTRAAHGARAAKVVMQATTNAALQKLDGLLQRALQAELDQESTRTRAEA